MKTCHLFLLKSQQYIENKYSLHLDLLFVYRKLKKFVRKIFFCVCPRQFVKALLNLSILKIMFNIATINHYKIYFLKCLQSESNPRIKKQLFSYDRNCFLVYSTIELFLVISDVATRTRLKTFQLKKKTTLRAFVG